MNLTEAIAALDAIKPGDPESSHIRADYILLRFVPQELADAYARLEQREGAWWFA